MKVLKIIGFVVLGLILLIVVLGLIAPGDYHAERSVQIEAPRDVVFSHVKYWRAWKAWSPWAEADPQMEITVEGEDGTVGSMYKWVGDPEITGRGEMTNTGLKENEEIKYHLHFIEPYESESDGWLRVNEKDGITTASWGFQGEVPFPFNVTMLFVSMESMMKDDFDRGLTLLKTVSEEEHADLKGFEIKTVKFPGKTYAVIQKVISVDQMPQFFGNSMATLGQATQQKGVRMIGAPSGLYYTWDEQNQTTNLAAAMPINGTITTDEIKTIKIAASNALQLDLYGSYDGLGMAHKALNLYITREGITSKPPAIEEYLTDPGAVPDTSQWLTRIYYLTE